MGMKAAQMGFTEVCLNRSLYTIDIKRLNVLYILPAKSPDATDFSADRFDGALELSPYLASLFSDVKNVGHKRAGSVSLYLRGAKSRSGLKSIPAALIVYDEFDEMDPKMVILAEERSSGQTYSQDIRISTPTVPKTRITLEYENSSQEQFAYRCPHCNQWQTLDFDNCFHLCGEHANDPKIAESFYYCPNCKTPIPHEEKVRYFRPDNTEWVKGKSDFLKRGFRIPQHYSSAEGAHPRKMARLMHMAQYDPAAEAELYNSKYGLAREVAGARVDGVGYELAKQLELYNGDYPNGFDFITIGIDVGAFYHIKVNAVTLLPSWDGQPDTYHANCRVHHVWIGKVKETLELNRIIQRWNPLAFCIDANPETREAKELCAAYPGCGYRVQYSRDRTASIASLSGDFILAGRSYWLDSYLGRYKRPKESISIPNDVTNEDKDNLQNICKHYSRNDKGEYEAEYIATGADHYAHAGVYAEIAIRATLFDRFGPSLNISEEIF
jgi:hypothetical protein